MSSRRATKQGGNRRTRNRTATTGKESDVGYAAALAATPYARQARALARKPPKKSGRGMAAGRGSRPNVKPAASYRNCAATARDTSKRPNQRISALKEMTRGVLEDANRFRAVLRIVVDQNEPTSVRLAALQTLEAATFAVVRFDPYRNEYLKALRIIMNDEDAEVRSRALGVLARMSDGQAQQLLLTGLKEPGKALVSPEKALQLLSYDVHADAYSVARELVSKPPSKVARRAALRLLAADAASAPLFMQLLNDKAETLEIRQLSATALHAISPDKLQANARKIVLDSKEDDRLKAVSLTALTALRRPDEGNVDDKLYKHVSRVHGRSSSTLVKRTARRFLKKYKR